MIGFGFLETISFFQILIQTKQTFFFFVFLPKSKGDQPRRAQKNVDSYQRLFGEPERPVTPAKNHMKSNIPFGAKTEAAQALITNGNGNGHYNGKSGSVSSASSSVSSSTENLKMNGFSKTGENLNLISIFWLKLKK